MAKQGTTDIGAPKGYQRADVYDAIYAAMKDYRIEAYKVFEIAERITGKKASDMTLLDVACGTGLHLEYFAMWFKHVAGVDLSSEQLEAARKRLTDITLVRANMLNLQLGTPGFLGPNPAYYDVVTCLFSAIGHMQDIEQLRMAIDNMAKHLHLGGVLIVEPWLTPDSWEPGHVSFETVDKPDFKVARISRSTRKGRITTLEMHHVVGTPDGIEDYVEEIPVALFTQEEYEAAFLHAGLEVTFNSGGLSDNGRGIYIGTFPSGE